MLVIKKNQIIVTALLVVVAVAGYISYTDNTDMDFAKQFGEVSDGVEVSSNEPKQEDQSLGDAVFTSINKDKSVEDTKKAEEQEKVKEDALNIEQKQNDGSTSNLDQTASGETVQDDYFVAEKLLRDKQYQQTLSQKASILNNQNVSKEDKKEVAAVMASMDSNYQKAIETERLLKGRGYDPTLVTFGVNGKVNVDVNQKDKKLSRKDIAKIKSVVMMQVQTSEDKIVIHPME